MPRAAFEVWLPLPSLLAAMPIALAGAAELVPGRAGRFGAGRRPRSRPWPGAWPPTWPRRLRLPVGRARTLAVGTGLVCRFLGPLVVYGVLPDSTALFAALALARLPADDAPGAARRERRDRRLLGPGLPDRRWPRLHAQRGRLGLGLLPGRSTAWL